MGSRWRLIKYPPNTTDFSAALTRAKGLNPGHRSFLVQRRCYARLPFRKQCSSTWRKATFSLASTPASGHERKLVSTAPVTLSCVPMCWGAPPTPEAKAYFDHYFAAGAVKGVQSSVSLLYYDYVPLVCQGDGGGRHDRS